MTTYFYFDTETSDFHEDDNPSLPVEVAAVLGDEERVFGTMSFVVAQHQWVKIHLNPIAERVIKIHGINQEIARRYGEAPDLILNTFRNMVARADYVVAHNISFDLGVMNNAFAAQTLPAMNWPPRFCTMRESAGILRIPSGGRYAIGGFKAPRLSEAYQWFAKKALQNAHNALTDVYACRLVHKGILRHQREEQDAANQPRPE